MYKLLIVDDEPLVQVGMQSMIDYGALGVAVVGTAANGEAALAMIRELAPDIVIIDIKMPLKTGLEVIEEVAASGMEPPVFVVLTGFDDFEYARKAVRLGVCDFVLKLELNRELLFDVMERVLARLRDRAVREQGDSLPDMLEVQRTALADRFFARLLNGLFDSPEDLEEMRADAAVDFRGRSYAVLYCDTFENGGGVPGERSTSILYLSNILRGICVQYFGCHVMQWDLGGLVIVCAFDDTAPFGDETGPVAQCLRHIRNVVPRYLNLRVQIGAGSCVESLADLPVSLSESLMARRSCTPEQPVVYFDRIIDSKPYRRSFNIAIIAGALTRAFRSYDTEAIERCLAEVADLFREHGSRPQQAVAMCSSILHFVMVSFHDGADLVREIFASDEDPFYQLYELRSVGQAAAWLESLSRGLCRRVANDFALSRNWLVPGIKAYIEEHYSEKLSLADVAEAFDVSAGYVSAIFKKYNDTGFSECVTQVKIGHAQQLFRETEMKIHEVSNLLGYSDPYYFSKVFKKVTGVSPREYQARRETHL